MVREDTFIRRAALQLQMALGAHLASVLVVVDLIGAQDVIAVVDHDIAEQAVDRAVLAKGLGLDMSGNRRLAGRGNGFCAGQLCDVGRIRKGNGGGGSCGGLRLRGRYRA